MDPFESAQTSLNNFRQKYPQYGDVDDVTLAKSLGDKYPQYRDIVGAVIPANLKPPEQGQLEQGLGQFARDNPGTAFDFTSLNTVDPNGQLSPTFQGPSPDASVNDAISVLSDPDMIEQTKLSGASREAGQALMQNVADLQVPEAIAPAQQALQNKDYGAYLDIIDAAQQQNDSFQMDLAQQERLNQLPEALRQPAAQVVASGIDKASMIARLFELKDGDNTLADKMQHDVARLTANAQKTAPGMVNNVLGGLARVAADIGLMGRPSGGHIYAAFGLNAANSAITEGRDAGLEGPMLAEFAIKQGATEMLLAKAFDKLGLAGAERFADPARKVVKETFGKYAVSLLRQGGAEVVEELATGAVQAWNAERTGVNPNALAEFKQSIPETIVIAGLSGGAPTLVGAISAKFRPMNQAGPSEQAPAQVQSVLPDSTPWAVPARPGIEQLLIGQATAPVAAKEHVPGQPDVVSDDGGSATFTTTKRSPAEAQAEAESYRQSLIEGGFGEADVTVVPRRGNTGFDVQINPGMHEAAQVLDNADQLTDTQKRKFVKDAKALGFTPTGSFNTLTAEMIQAVLQDKGIAPSLPTDAGTQAVPQAVDTLTDTPAAEAPQTPAPSAQQVKQLAIAEAINALAGTVKGVTQGRPTTRPQAAAVRIFEDAGINAAIVDGAKFKGVTVETESGPVVLIGGHLDEDGVRQTTAHELSRAIGLDRNPALAAGLNIEPYVKKYNRLLQASVKAGAHSPSFLDQHMKNPEAQQRGGLALMIGEVMKSPTAFRQLAKTKPTLVQKIVDWVSNFSNRVTGKSKLIENVIAEFERVKTEAGFKNKDTGSGEAQRSRMQTMDKSVATPVQNATLNELASNYAGKDVTVPTEPMAYADAVELAAAYNRMEHNPNDPAVKKAYDAFTKETLDQFNYLKKQGYVFDLVDTVAVTDAYPDVTALVKDLADNKHLFVNSQPGDMPVDHPMMGVAPGTGGMSHNQVFRAVHDVMGHAQRGHGFTTEGEEMAWREHSQMYSEDAKPALATETRGQSTWVGYNQESGEQNQENVALGDIGAVVFPEQKAALLPSKFHDPSSDPTDTAQDIKDATHPASLPADQVADQQGWVAKIVESTVSRITDLSNAVGQRLWKMEYNSKTESERLKQAFAKMAVAGRKAESKMSAQEKSDFRSSLFSQDRAAALAIMQKHDVGVTNDMQDAFTVLDSLADAQQQAGINLAIIKDYWPRTVKDSEAFKQHLADKHGKDLLGVFEEQIALAANVKGRNLSKAEELDVINKTMQGYGPRKPGDHGPLHARHRSLAVVDKADVEFYTSPWDSFDRYISNAVYAVERAKFLGKGADNVQAVKDSVGLLVDQELQAGNLNRKKQQELKDLLAARFSADFMPTPGWIQKYKAFTYAVTLGNFKSALTQITDMAFTIYSHGPIATAMGLYRALTKNDRRIAMQAIGLHEHGEEFRDTSAMEGALDKILTYSGFKTMDRIGKETRINAAKIRFERIAKTAAGSNERQELSEYFGPVMTGQQIDQALSDLAAGKLTDDAGYMLFLDIAKIQPLTLSQMPKAYLSSPSARILYTLKTFTGQQLNFLRTEILRDLNTPGKRKRGAENLGRYTLLITMFSMGQQWLKDFLFNGPEEALDPEDLAHADNFFSNTTGIEVPDRVVDGMLSTIGLSRYNIEQVGQRPTDAIKDYLSPPARILDDIATDISRGIKGELDDKGVKTIRSMPLVGELLYNGPWFFPLGVGAGEVKNFEDLKKRQKKRVAQVVDKAVEAYSDGDTQLASQLVRMAQKQQMETFKEEHKQWQALPPAEKGKDNPPPKPPASITMTKVRNQYLKDEE